MLPDVSLVKEQVFMREEGMLALCPPATGVLDDRGNICTLSYEELSVSSALLLAPQGNKGSWPQTPHIVQATLSLNHAVGCHQCLGLGCSGHGEGDYKSHPEPSCHPLWPKSMLQSKDQLNLLLLCPQNTSLLSLSITGSL